MLAAFLADAKSTIKARTNRDETGATAVEYGIMVALIAVVIIATVTLLGGSLNDKFVEVQCSITGGDFSAAEPAGADPVADPATEASCA